MSKQQTAVEWLEEKIKSNLNNPMSVKFQEMFEQAKQLERQQIINHHAWLLSGVMHEEVAIKDSEQYYKETFGK